jgi:predicted ester cyclase
MATPLDEVALARTIDWINGVLSPVAKPAAVVRRFIDEVVNGGDLGAVDEIWAPDLIWHGGSMGDVRGMAAFQQHLKANASGAFTAMRLQIDDLIEAGDKVIVRFTNGGTQSGPFMGMPASGRSARWLGIGIYKVTAGKISEAWFGEDILGMLLQLGAITLPA